MRTLIKIVGLIESKLPLNQLNIVRPCNLMGDPGRGLIHTSKRARALQHENARHENHVWRHRKCRYVATGEINHFTLLAIHSCCNFSSPLPALVLCWTEMTVRHRRRYGLWTWAIYQMRASH